jgi:hypothetical protein
MKIKRIVFLIFLVMGCQSLLAQGSLYYERGYKIKFNDNEDKYLRIITWAQVQANYSDNRLSDEDKDEADVNFQLRRARLLFFGQITKKFLIMARIGLNSLNQINMSPAGVSSGSQIFIHDDWAQYNLTGNHVVGTGLHYWNGPSRLSSQSILNLLTLHNNRASSATIGLSAQFAIHIGVFDKGNFDKFQYQIALNDAVVNGLDNRNLLLEYQNEKFNVNSLNRVNLQAMIYL